MASTSMARHENAGIEMNGPILTQPTFNWRAGDKYDELQNFQVEASNMLQNYNLGQREGVSVIKNWVDREGLQLMAHLTKEEQDGCNDEKGLFENLRKKFKPQFNETIKSLQFCKLVSC